MITWITVSSSMIGRICGTSTRSCRAATTRAVDARRLGRLGREREQSRREHDDAEAELLPDHEPADGDDRQVRVAEPVLRERPQVQVTQRRVEHAVLLQQERERDPDRGRRQHVRQKDDRLVLAHAADAVVEHERDREPEPEHHRHREQQLEVVQERLAELGVVDDALVVVETRPRSASRSCPRRSCRARPARAG